MHVMISGRWLFSLPSLLPTLDPAPRGAGLVQLCQFGVLLWIAGSSTQAFAGFARVKFQFGPELLEGDDVGHDRLLGGWTIYPTRRPHWRSL